MVSLEWLWLGLNPTFVAGIKKLKLTNLVLTLVCLSMECRTLLTLDTAPSHVEMCRWLTSYFPRSQFQVL